MHTLQQLTDARYALLRSFRRDGTPADTPIWFAMDGDALVFRTKIGPKTKRLAARPDIELRACDYRGRVRKDAAPMAGRAALLSGADAERGNRLLHERYGWQWNIVPLLKIPGVTNVHRDLALREKLRRARDRGVWADSAIVRVDLA
ncbi:PPOX class F420-dependent oxidoreductase [Mycobacterium montefiorense]|uniref:PPOX class F420-dependent oxidoreductase n=1 Tax=Mycobacterium montefiorense TaxID=154654 RepID=A0AA37PJE3_9MYCO|nr:PPOX class F420-dependent oxidoreductase [Mycobacterium montefiorense]GBG38524.1 PPOX class F420-dependent oxidoreductase [Mycobacterium montefiorense]GKU34352.1 PPOX class F420-dependent oxidoreductase [Mycobacterium montefiorense]GKU38973.1 PPOX class F420-dependent oxidoreductase [Mycobacterium montefiorense]GKU47989.1 PPOX class F420-dependent oxidoreductase [Mycobacterium montefiorense]GKU49738.1 PPOX class F420-dependent oxidoreductase [Mycobacterium montefiorense]